MAPKENPDDLMTVADAGKILGVSADMVRLLDRNGRLHALRTTGGIRLFRRADVEQLAEERDRKRRITEAAPKREPNAKLSNTMPDQSSTRRNHR